ncbi:MAG: hypothetical protein ACUVUU_00395 [bacterium]
MRFHIYVYHIDTYKKHVYNHSTKVSRNRSGIVHNVLSIKEVLNLGEGFG